MDALTVAIIYFGTFLVLGVILKLAIKWWTRRRNFDLTDMQRDAGPNRGKRRVGLLGFWRNEGPD
jgi:hypothetical protein